VRASPTTYNPKIGYVPPLLGSVPIKKGINTSNNQGNLGNQALVILRTTAKKPWETGT